MARSSIPRARPDGEAIRQARERLGWSRESLIASVSEEQRITLSLDTLKRAEAGQSRIEMRILQAIADQLKLPVSRILRDRAPGVPPDGHHTLLDLVVLEISQQQLASAIANELGYGDRPIGGVFYEQTGDLDARLSRLVLADGAKLRFSDKVLTAAYERLLEELAEPLLARGLVVTCWVVQGFKARWGKSEDQQPIPASEPILCLLEGLGQDPAKVDSDRLLAQALADYVYDLPDDADRTFLNSMPEPSPTERLLAELVRREAWPVLCDMFGDIAGINFPVAIHWAYRITSQNEQVRDPAMRQLLERTDPKDDRWRSHPTRLLEVWCDLPPDGA
jgi:transcriptional regulator with XRE-family HTH domain